MHIGYYYSNKDNSTLIHEYTVVAILYAFNCQPPPPLAPPPPHTHTHLILLPAQLHHLPPPLCLFGQYLPVWAGRVDWHHSTIHPGSVSSDSDFCCTSSPHYSDTI